MIPLILKFGTAEWIMKTDRYILDTMIQLDQPDSEIVKINKSFTSFMYENSYYKDFIPLNILKKD